MVIGIKAKEIARELGLSPATVSLAINNKPGINEETRRKVLEYISQFSPRPDKLGEKKGKAVKSVVCVNNNQMASGDIRQILTFSYQGMYEVITKQGMELILCHVYNGRELKRLVEESRRDGTGGLIIQADEFPDEELSALNDAGLPVVVFDNKWLYGKWDKICIDNQQAVWKAMDYLYGHGCRNIMYLANSYSVHNFEERRRWFGRYMLEKKNCDPSERIIRLGETPGEIYDNARKYLSELKALPDGFLSENFVVSISMIKALKDCGLKVPEDVSILGIDKLPDYALTDYKFTYINIDHEIKAKQAVNVLLEKINSREKEAFVQILFGTELMEGESVKGCVYSAGN